MTTLLDHFLGPTVSKYRRRWATRLAVGLVLIAVFLGLPRPSRGAWETIGDWKVIADDCLSVRRSDRAMAWNPAITPGRSWSFHADVKVRRAADALVGSASLVLGDLRRNPQLAISVCCRAGQLSMIQVETVAGAKRRTILSSQWIPGGDEAFSLRLFRVGHSLKILVYGDKYLAYTEQTPELPAVVLDAVATFGLGAEAADVEFSALKFQSPWAEAGHYAAQAEAAIGDLTSHFWTGGLDQGCIVPTSHGYPAFDPSNARGGLWERAMMAFAMDTFHRATGDPTIPRRLNSEWARLKRLYTVEELEAAGGPLHPACDDVGWDALYYLVLYRHSHDRDALECAKGLVNHAFRRWLDSELGGGLWYNDQRKTKSLYGVAVVMSALEISQTTADAAMKEKAIGCYRWMESQLLRPDGIYWADRDRQGPVGAAEPQHIGEAGSVSFLAGNMAMGVLHARLYRLTGEKVYLDRAIRTADAIARKLAVDGVLLDDRDAWTNGTFAGDWAQEVLRLPGVEGRHKELLLRTADSIYRKARTSQGYYGGSWNGPAEGPGSAWCLGGSRPQQIMTSASSVHVIAAAALAGCSLTTVTKSHQGEASKTDSAGRHDFHPGRQAP
jgi:predicted alpha-1,6-mannanase (GH76 family)